MISPSGNTQASPPVWVDRKAGSPVRFDALKNSTANAPSKPRHVAMIVDARRKQQAILAQEPHQALPTATPRSAALSCALPPPMIRAVLALGSDHRDLADDLRIERQEPVVLEQHRALGAGTADQRAMSGPVVGHFLMRMLVVDGAGPHREAQHVERAVLVQQLADTSPASTASTSFCAAIARRARHFDIEAGVDRGRGRVASRTSPTSRRRHSATRCAAPWSSSHSFSDVEACR